MDVLGSRVLASARERMVPADSVEEYTCASEERATYPSVEIRAELIEVTRRDKISEYHFSHNSHELAMHARLEYQ